MILKLDLNNEEKNKLLSALRMYQNEGAEPEGRGSDELERKVIEAVETAQRRVKPKYRRSVDCEDWAIHKISSLPVDHAQLYHLVPMVGDYLGAVRVSEEEVLVAISPRFHHHYAVLYKGRMYDEHYPDGIDENIYKGRFVNSTLIEYRLIEGPIGDNGAN